MFIPDKILLILPVTLPVLSSLVLLFFWNKHNIQQILQVAAGTLHLGISAVLFAEASGKRILTTQIGNWPAPYGITFFGDKINTSTLLVSSLVSFAVSLFSIHSLDKRRVKFGFYPTYYFMLAAISGLLLTGDIFNLFVWFELMLITSFVLLVIGSNKIQLEGTIKYATLNMLSSFLLLIGIGLLYGASGTLNYAHLAELLPQINNTHFLYLIASFFLVSLGIKTAIFPVYFWLPASYPVPPSPVSAIFGGILAKIGFYVLLRVFTLIFFNLQDSFKEILLVISAFTMITAVLGAVAHHHFKKILSVHVVSQVGYLTLALGIFTISSYAAAIFFLIHIVIVKTNLFLISGLTARLEGTYNVYKLGNGIKRNPVLAILFLINAFSLAGVPPFSGFWGKFFIIKSSIDQGYYILAAVGLITGLFTLISMTKIWKEAFWKENSSLQKKQSLDTGEVMTYYTPIFLLTLVVLLLSIKPDLGYSFAVKAAKQLAYPANYINAVLK